MNTVVGHKVNCFCSWFILCCLVANSRI